MRKHAYRQTDKLKEQEFDIYDRQKDGQAKRKKENLHYSTPMILVTWEDDFLEKILATYGQTDTINHRNGIDKEKVTDGC